MAIQNLNNAVFSVEKKELSLGEQLKNRMWQQGKQISQIISYTWRYYDDKNESNKAEIAKTLKHEYFEKHLGSGNFDYKFKKLEELLTADPKSELDYPTRPISKESQLLISVFGETGIREGHFLCPIFHKEELASPGVIGLKFYLDVNSFQGRLIDADINDNTFFKYYIAYPPCPALGEGCLTKEQLENWIANIDPNGLPSSPYIPTSSS
ncbi:hypothetical protein [Nostoc sp. 'Peltigera malacea cyanobiont' DB3992]|uniref:hypothetical protein n=1 Tax=Nostoc sp. 'Peltigera malacea cyanobiont' DB3992 TaxID=1206980 RepID=UPI000C040CE8|nr:hypothetical protein [Nostoc sp. 'Peltigera malacea cyanobiont' DB3992]PHM06219.1 hypothetical protein CK516_35205 [Nostoc sp. 'Peltigera malacea cyanobiont' DB3992]